MIELTLPTPNKTPGDGSPAGDMNLVVEAIDTLASAVAVLEQAGIGDDPPKPLGPVFAGSSAQSSREDHVHPIPVSGIEPSAIVGTAVVTSDARLSDQRVPTDGSVTSAKITAGGISAASVTGTAVVTSDARLSDQRIPTDGSVTTGKIAAGGIAPSAVTGTAVITTDARLSDARTPTAHASSHGSAGSDPVTVANTQVTGLGTASTKNVPAAGDAASGEAVLGSDTRLTNSRTPTAHAASHGSAGSDPVTVALTQVTDLSARLSVYQAGEPSSPQSGQIWVQA